MVTRPESDEIDEVFLRQLELFLRVGARYGKENETGVSRWKRFAASANNGKPGLWIQRGGRLEEGRA